MKKLSIITLFISGSFMQVYANGDSFSGGENENTSPKELTLTLKNTSTFKVAVYAGNKKLVFEGPKTVYGGLSSNLLYLQEGDAVCIMKDDKTIQACSFVKEGVTKLEINSSANGFNK